MPFFSSYPIPPEIVIEAGEARLARPRIDPAEWLATFVGDEPAGGVQDRELARPDRQRAGALPPPSPAQGAPRRSRGRAS
jgi:hypothetical protein